MTEREAAREALDQIAAARRATAERAASPRGYYTMAGAGMGVVMIGLASEGWLRWVLYALGLLTVLGALTWYSQHTGIVAWATLREPGSWRAWLMIAVALAGLGVSWLGLLAATIAAVVTVVGWSILGPRWDADWVRSLEEQP